MIDEQGDFAIAEFLVDPLLTTSEIHDKYVEFFRARSLPRYILRSRKTVYESRERCLLKQV
jgi:hypothetical protein